MRTAHNTPAQSTHPTNTTNQSLTTPSQTNTAPTDSTPGTPPREQATNPPTAGTLHTASPTSSPAINQPIHSTPLTAPAIVSRTSAPTPSTPQITPVDNHQQSKSAQQNKQDIKILQIKITGVHKKLTELAHIMKTNNIDIATAQEAKLANHHKTPTIQHTQN